MDELNALWQSIQSNKVLIQITVAAGRIALILVGAWVIWAFIKKLLAQLEIRWLRRGRQEDEPLTESQKRVDTLVGLVKTGLMLLLLFTVITLILVEVGIKVGPLLASAGIVGVAVGFGAQSLVKDVISGFFMILENQVRIGDVAIINGTAGLVEKINFRTMVLRDLSGVVHVFPNGSIDTISNMTKDWSAQVLDIGVAYKEDIDHVMTVMRQVGDEMRQDPHYGPLMIENIEIFGLDSFGDSAIVVKMRLKTLPIKQWEVGREYRRRLKVAFDEAGIEIPFPHRSIYFGEASKPFVTQLMETARNK